MSDPEAPSTPSTPALDDAARWKLCNFRPRRPVTPSNDPRLDAFLSGAVDFTDPDFAESETEDSSRW